MSISGGRILVLRHGETEWSRTGRHTGRTDVPLTARGKEQARAAAQALEGHTPVAVLVSPLRRAWETAQLAGLTSYDVDPDLAEWHYGDLEGITTPEWQVKHPGWSVWGEGPTGGETIAEVGARADRVLARVGPLLDGTDDADADAGRSGERSADDDEAPEHPTVVLVGHGHLLRVLAARWLGLEPASGALFRLDPATVSLLGKEHDRPVLLRWNSPISAPG